MIKYTIQIIDDSDEVWMWVHQKYGMGLILQNFYPFETKTISYLAVPYNDQLNQFNNSIMKFITLNSKTVK